MRFRAVIAAFNFIGLLLGPPKWRRLVRFVVRTIKINLPCFSQNKIDVAHPRINHHNNHPEFDKKANDWRSG